MPACNRCNHSGATADFRRSPKGGHLCNDKTACERRRLGKLNDWATLDEHAHRVSVHASAVEEHVSNADTMRALASCGVLADEYSQLAVDLSIAASREGKTQKDIANALGVPVSSLRGLKRHAS